MRHEFPTFRREKRDMGRISSSSLFMVGRRVAKYCGGATLRFDRSLRTGSSLLSSAFRRSMTVVEAYCGRMASSTVRALSEASAGLLFCFVFNILIITGVAVLCISGYGFAAGLVIVLLALAPTLMLVNIALFSSVENEQQPSLLRAISTNSKDLERGETLSIVPETSETADTRSDAIDPISVSHITLGQT
jgi:hypothetical protein